MRRLAVVAAILLLAALFLSACGGKESIVGKWWFTPQAQSSWDYEWIEFFEDGTCTDNWGNDRSWMILSDGRLKLRAGAGAGTYLFDIKVTGDKMEIADEGGNHASGTRSIHNPNPNQNGIRVASTRLPEVTDSPDLSTPASEVQELASQLEPVAIVNGVGITTRDYQKRVKFDWFQAGEVTDPEGTSLKTLDTMVDEQLLREQAQQRGITVTEDEISETIEKSFGYLRVSPIPIPSPTPDPQATPSSEPTATPAPSPTPVSLEAYEKAKKAYLDRLDSTTGMSEADFRKIVELDLLRQKLYDEVTKDVPTVGEQVRARHILVAIRTPEPTAEPTAVGGPTPDPNAPTPTPAAEPRDDAQALARIVAVQQKLGAGEDFVALALEYSDDPGSKDSGGELGWFAQGQGLVAEFEEAAFKLQAGEISPPVKTQFGYHIFQVEEREVDAYTMRQKKYEAYQTWLTKLRDSATIDLHWTLGKIPATPSVPFRQ